MPQQYPSNAAFAGRSARPMRSLARRATIKGVNAIQQKALRQIGTGPAIAKGNACKSADATASNHRRGEIERIIGKFSSRALQKYPICLAYPRQIASNICLHTNLKPGYVAWKSTYFIAIGLRPVASCVYRYRIMGYPVSL